MAKPNRMSAPGPKTHHLLSVARGLLSRRRELDYIMQLCREYGDFAKLPFPGTRVYVLSHPDYVKHVLQENHLNYGRDPSFERLKLVLGENLLTSEGEFWRRQRRIAQPAFHRRSILGFTSIFTSCTQAMLERWEEACKGGRTLEVHREMMRLSMDVASRALFGISAGPVWEQAVQAFITTQEWGYRRRWLPIPLSIPTPWNRRFKEACRILDRIVYGIIARRRNEGGDRNDLLTMLMQARDEETGEGMSDQQLRNEVLTLFSAGYETTSNSLAWTLYLLSRSPSVFQKLEDEVDHVLGDRVPSAEDSARLAYARMVIQESLRLYPPARVISRRAIQDDVIGGHRVPAGSIVLMFQWVVHRHPDFWDDPEEFDPERFAPERSADRHPYAYFPFGGGPRKCIGYEFALAEAQVALVMIVRRFRLSPVTGHPVEPDPVITLKPRYGILMHLHRRFSQPTGSSLLAADESL